MPITSAPPAAEPETLDPHLRLDQIRCALEAEARRVARLRQLLIRSQQRCEALKRQAFQIDEPGLPFHD